jgi:hypothetical protein
LEVERARTVVTPTLTLIEAAIRNGQSNLAQHYIAEPTVRRPSGSLGRRLFNRAGLS